MEEVLQFLIGQVLERPSSGAHQADIGVGGVFDLTPSFREKGKRLLRRAGGRGSCGDHGMRRRRGLRLHTQVEHVREREQLGFRRLSLLLKDRRRARGRREREEPREWRFRGVGYDDMAAPEKVGSRAGRVTCIRL